MPRFEDLGVPVVRPALKGVWPIARPAGQAGSEVWACLSCQQTAGRLFLLAVDPADGRALQWDAAEGPGAWAGIVGPDGRVYLGTWDGALVLRFDPARPEQGIVPLGRPAPTETYIWQYALGADGWIYGCTYPQARLVRIRPADGRLEDLGRLDEDQMYARTLASGPDGVLYVGIGYGRADVVAWDPGTGRGRGLLPPEERDRYAVADVAAGADGAVYARTGSVWYRCAPSGLQPAAGPPPAPRLTMGAGWTLEGADLGAAGEGTLRTRSSAGAERAVTFRYRGSGSSVFVVAEGPRGRIYGSSVLPLEVFEYDPGTGRMADLGAPGRGGGELYSLLAQDDLLYMAAYPGSVLSVYDVRRPWGEPGNPRVIGPMGEGHLRPHALCRDGRGRLWVGSAPEYGRRGGALGVYDPAEGCVTGAWRGLVPEQTIHALCLDPRSGLLWGGSSVTGGGGTRPVDADAHLFAWDPEAREPRLDLPLASVRHVVAMAYVSGRIVAALTPGPWLAAFEPGTGAELWRVSLPGAPRAQAVRAAPNGRAWVLAGDRVLSVDAGSGALVEVGRAPAGIGAGLGVTPQALYFGSGAHLWRLWV